MPFYYGYTYLINLKNKNRLDKYIIFTSECQMNLITKWTKCNQILTHGTFKCCPKTIYQVINIIRFYPDMNSIISLFFIPTKGKSEYI